MNIKMPSRPVGKVVSRMGNVLTRKAFLRAIKVEVESASDFELLEAYEDFASVQPIYRDEQEEELIVLVREELLKRLRK